MKKRYISVISMLVISIAFTGCGTEDNTVENNDAEAVKVDVKDLEEEEEVSNVFYALPSPFEMADRKSTRLNSSHSQQSRMPSSA